jgi:hypothetical protein
MQHPQARKLGRPHSSLHSPSTPPPLPRDPAATHKAVHPVLDLLGALVLEARIPRAPPKSRATPDAELGAAHGARHAHGPLPDEGEADIGRGEDHGCGLGDLEGGMGADLVGWAESSEAFVCRGCHGEWLLMMEVVRNGCLVVGCDDVSPVLMAICSGGIDRSVPRNDVVVERHPITRFDSLSEPKSTHTDIS